MLLTLEAGSERDRSTDAVVGKCIGGDCANRARAMFDRTYFELPLGETVGSSHPAAEASAWFGENCYLSPRQPAIFRRSLN